LGWDAVGAVFAAIWVTAIGILAQIGLTLYHKCKMRRALDAIKRMHEPTNG
jgi:hypothetical protein